MSDLDWRETSWGYECDGYRIVAEADDGVRRWRLEPYGAVAGWPGSEDGRVTLHRSFEEAVRWAERDEHEAVRRTVAFGHFLIAGISLILFVFLSQFIGTLTGLGRVAAAFYLTLRSAGNGLGAILDEAWGWTRPRSKKPTILERLVLGLARRNRRNRLAAMQSAAAAQVRELAPDSPG